MNRSGWSPQRRLVAGFLCTAIIVSIFSPWMPLGAVLWLLLAVMVRLWPTMDQAFYMPDSFGGRVSENAEQFRPLLFMGFTRRPWRLGPEGDNDQMLGDLAQGLDENSQPKPQMPEQGAALFHPIAMNSIVAALVAVIFAGLELVATANLNRIPWPASFEQLNVVYLATMDRPIWLAAISALSGWVFAKAMAAWKRQQVDPEGGPPPTILIENAERHPHATWGGFVKELLNWRAISIFVVGAGSSGAAWYFLPTIHSIFGYAWFMVTVPIFVLLAGRNTFSGWTSEQQEAWLDFQNERRQWMNNWMSVLPSSKTPPYLNGYIELPPDNPLFKRMVFTFSVGLDFKTLLDTEKKLTAAQNLTCELINISPGLSSPRQPSRSWIFLEHELPNYDQWVQSRQMRWQNWNRKWQTQIDSSTAYLDPQINNDMRVFLFQRALARALRELNIGTLLPGGPLSQRSVDDAPVYLQWGIPLYGNMTHTRLMSAIPDIASRLGVNWLRIAPEGASNIASCHACLLHPDKTNFPRSIDKKMRSKIAELDWSYWMAAARLVGADGISTPELKENKIANPEEKNSDAQIHEMQFELPAGLTVEQVVESLPKLQSASDYSYVDVRRNPNPSRFTLLAGRQDPLDATYLFADYESDLLRRPVRTKPRPGWFVGAGPDGNARPYEWDHEDPHLLVAGASGSGKSVLLNLMLLQLLHNNDPEDVNLWLLEPKNELQMFQHAKHVKIFIDSNVAESSNIWEVAQLTFAQAVREMERRYTLMATHPNKPKKIQECRALAEKDPENNGELNFPFLFIVMEECTSYFAKPPLAAYKKDHDLLVAYTEELARKGRASGIHMIFATQNPVAAALPTTIKRQCRRIGLKTTDLMGSRVIIDRPGLEKIQTTGRGLMTGDHGYEGFRSYFIPTDMLQDRLRRVVTTTKWPKLPDGVNPSQNVDIHEEEEDIPLELPMPDDLPDATFEGKKEEKPQQAQGEGRRPPRRPRRPLDDGEDGPPRRRPPRLPMGEDDDDGPPRRRRRPPSLDDDGAGPPRRRPRTPLDEDDDGDGPPRRRRPPPPDDDAGGPPRRRRPPPPDDDDDGDGPPRRRRPPPPDDDYDGDGPPRRRRRPPPLDDDDGGPPRRRRPPPPDDDDDGHDPMPPRSRPQPPLDGSEAETAHTQSSSDDDPDDGIVSEDKAWDVSSLFRSNSDDSIMEIET